MTGPTYLVADLFCGAGGSSTGAERALREMGAQMELACVNHWPIAVETHKLNHPTARHYVEDVSIVDPEQVVPEGYLDLLMASPECRYYSRARGGKPVQDQGRMNPWAIHKWLTALNVRCVLVENVPEFVHWGPLDAAGKPDKTKKGVFFEAWIKAFWNLGYTVEWKFLNSADYGDATTRQRFFLQARHDGRPIQWPERTHTKDGSQEMFDGPAKWRGASEIIDWENRGRSLLDDERYRRKPLSVKTRERIAKGLAKFGGPLAPLYIRLLGLEPEHPGAGANGLPRPFIMGKQGRPSYKEVEEPLLTLTTLAAPNLVEPTATRIVWANRNNNIARSAEDPIPPATTAPGGGIYVAQAEAHLFLMGKQGNSPAYRSVEQPIPTVTTDGATVLVEAAAEPFVLGQHSGSTPRSTESPIPTVVATGNISLIQPVIVQFYGNSKGCDPNQPLPTVTTKARFGVVNPMIVPYGPRADARAVDEPLPTVMTKDRLALAAPGLEALAEVAAQANIDPHRLVLIDSEPYVLDIRFRMLTNLELARATSFEDEEFSYEFVGNIGEVTRQIGNAVSVRLATALVTSMLKEEAPHGSKNTEKLR